MTTPTATILEDETPTDPLSRELWGYGVWGVVLLLILIPEISAAASSRVPWPTISATVGHLEYLRDWVALIVAAVIVLIAIQMVRYPSGSRQIFGQPLANVRKLTPGGRITVRMSDRADISELVFGVGILLVAAGSASTAEWDPSDKFALGYVLWGLIAGVCIAFPSIMAFGWAKDVPFPTFYRTLRNLERRAHFMSALLLIGLVILLIHLVLYPWPNVFHVLKGPSPASP